MNFWSTSMMNVSIKMLELFELYESYNLTHTLLVICFLMLWYDSKPADGPQPSGPQPRGSNNFHAISFERFRDP